MNKKNLHIICLMLFGGLSLQAQQDSAQFLNEVTVVDSRIKALQIAQFQYKTDSVKRINSPTASMAEWLQLVSSVHVRQYAPGSASSFSTRGATSAQSTILWSGFSLNSAATGVSDLSLIPTELYQPSILLGGSASYFGSGAIGGVLNLESEKTKKAWHAGFNQQFASFNTFSTNLYASFLNEKWTSKTAVLYNSSKNDFSFTNTYKIPQSDEKRQNAAYKQVHVNQLLAYRINDFQSLEAEVWFNNAERETPNSILVNKAAAAILTDNYLRSRLAWNYQKGNQQLQIGYAFLYEWQRFEDSTVINIYNESLNDTNITASHIVQLNHAIQLSRYLKWQNGLNIRFDEVSGSNRMGRQNTSGIQSGLIFSKIKLSAQAVIRAEIWNEKVLPFSPFASIRYEILKHVFASFYGGYNYRIPSLNDRFWMPGGNMNLKPESGWTGEAALFYKTSRKKENTLIRLAYYRSNLVNYIQWVPGQLGIWSPHNLKEVLLSGIDFNAEYGREFSVFSVSAELNVSYNNATVLASELKNDASIGQQVVYQPLFKITTGLNLGYHDWYVHGGYRYTSQVSTSYDGSTKDLDSFNLVDASISKSFRVKKLNITGVFAANNLLNVAYETIPYYPMPLSNYSLTIKISI